MKTEALIRALVADSGRPVEPLGRYLLAGVLAGAVLAVVLFIVSLHVRPDLGQALHTPLFVYKLLVATSLAVTSGALLSQIARPLPTSGRHRSLLLVTPGLLAIGVCVELWTQPAEAWLPRLVGHNAAHCLSLIPLLAAGPVLCLLVTLKRGAPAQPAFAGAVAGLVSSGVGATLYALTCPDDSPLFVATWYTLAVAVVTGVTAYTGRRMLRW